MNKLFTLVFVCLSVFVSGCEEKTPSDKLTSDTIRPIAEGEAMDGIVVDDFKKENGWQDTNAANTYNVRYSYNLKLTKPLPEVVLGLANGIFSDLADAKKNPGPMGVNALQAEINLAREASSWISAQQQEFPHRRDEFLSKCKPCMDYWNQEGNEERVREQRYAYVAAWSRLENIGFKDASTIGDKVPRFAWAGFMKTEQGWRNIKN